MSEDASTSKQFTCVGEKASDIKKLKAQSNIALCQRKRKNKRVIFYKLYKLQTVNLKSKPLLAD